MNEPLQRQRESNGKLPGGITGKGWRKGQSGNPLGRKRGGVNLTATLRRTLKREDAEEIAAKLVSLAKGGDIRAVQILFERLDAADFEQRLADLEAAVQQRPN